MSERKLLIADDRKRTCDRLARRLQRFGQIRTTARYEEALQLIAAEVYDAVLLDLSWREDGHAEPKGIELLTEAKKRRQDVFVIVFSARWDPMWESKVLRAGADAFLRKKPELITEVTRLLDMWWPREKPLPPPGPIEQCADKCLAELDALLEYFGDQVEAVNHFALFQEHLRQLWAMRSSREEEFAELVVLIESVTKHAEAKQFTAAQIGMLKVAVTRLCGGSISIESVTKYAKPQHFTTEQMGVLKDAVAGLREGSISREDLAHWRRFFRRSKLDIYRPLYNIPKIHLTVTVEDDSDDANESALS